MKLWSNLPPVGETPIAPGGVKIIAYLVLIINTFMIVTAVAPHFLPQNFSNEYGVISFSLVLMFGRAVLLIISALGLSNMKRWALYLFSILTPLDIVYLVGQAYFWGFEPAYLFGPVGQTSLFIAFVLTGSLVYLWLNQREFIRNS